MEALPGAGANIVRAGGVPTLCAKLLVFEYIDLAEQCLLVSLGANSFLEIAQVVLTQWALHQTKGAREAII